MKKPAWFIALVSCLPACSQHHQPQQHTSYAGQQEREIKALSADEMAGYRNGHGMGLAKAAELNHYPGPKHVLELANALGLSVEQRAAAQQVYDRMHARALRLGTEIVASEKELDSLFSSQKIDTTSLRDGVFEIARLQGELRAAHLLAHVEMKEILSKEQIAKYDEMRGYGQIGPRQRSRSAHPSNH